MIRTISPPHRVLTEKKKNYLACLCVHESKNVTLSEKKHLATHPCAKNIRASVNVCASDPSCTEPTQNFLVVRVWLAFETFRLARHHN